MKKTKFFEKKTEWLGHIINENGVKPTSDKMEALTKTPPPKNQKQLKSFSGAIQHLSKFKKNLSSKTDNLRKLLKKEQEWTWDENRQKEFEGLRRHRENTNLITF